jgi:hypothetical protein
LDASCASACCARSKFAVNLQETLAVPSVRAGPACASDVRLNEQVKRNAERFPEHFMFQLTAEEARLSR